MRRRTSVFASSLAVLIALAAFGGTSQAQGPVGRGPLGNPNGSALLLYAMETYPAWHIFQARGEEVGDAYTIPGFQVVRLAHRCYPGLSRQSYPIGSDDRSIGFETDLKAILEVKGFVFRGDASASVKLRTVSSIEIAKDPEPRLVSLDVSALRDNEAVWRTGIPDCDELHTVIRDSGNPNAIYDMDFLLIGELFYVDGSVTSEQEMIVEGSISAELETAVTDLLARLGISFRFEGEGRYRSVRNLTKKLRIDNPMAFNPLIVRLADYDLVTSLIANSELGGWLDRSQFSTMDMVNLLRSNRLIRDYVYCYEHRGMRGLREDDVKRINENEGGNCENSDGASKELLIVVNREDGSDYIRGRALLREIFFHMRELDVGKEDLEESKG